MPQRGKILDGPPKNNGFFGSRYFYPRPKGLVWHQFAQRIVWNCGSSAYGISRQAVFLRSPSILIPSRLRRIPYARSACDSIQCSALIWYVDNRVYARLKALLFSFIEATPTCKETSTRHSAKVVIFPLYLFFSYQRLDIRLILWYNEFAQQIK